MGFSTSSPGHRQEAPDAGQPDCVSPQKDARPPLCPPLPHPGQTRWVLIAQEIAVATWPVLCAPPPRRPLQYLCKWGRALSKHCHTLCDHQVLHTHLIQVGVNRAKRVLLCLSFKLPDFFDRLSYFFELV